MENKVSTFLGIDKKTHIILFIIAFAVAFCSCYNPLILRRPYIDSSVYVTITQAITRGLLPYLDIVDNKGPLTYLISVPCFILFGLTGICITEFFFLWISAIFAYKTALIFQEPLIALLGTIFSFVALLAFYLVNAGTEIYSFPFLMISFYIFTKYLFSYERNIKFYKLIVLGACFASTIMIKLNLFPLWAGFCIVIIFESLLKHKGAFKIFKYIFGFCIGILIIFIPIYLYLKINNIFELFIQQVIFGGIDRGFSVSSLKNAEKIFFVILERNNSALPLFLGAFWVIKYFKKPEFSFYLAYTISYFLFILFHSFSGGGVHYNLVFIPFFIPAVTFLVSSVYTAFSKIRFRILFLSLLFCLIFVNGIIRYFYYFALPKIEGSGKELIMAGRLIDENTKPGDEIVSLGNNCYIYPFTQRNAVSRFYYQGGPIDFIPGGREEFFSDVLLKKPKVIALLAGNDDEFSYQEFLDTPIFEMKEKYYSVLLDTKRIKLYIIDEGLR